MKRLLSVLLMIVGSALAHDPGISNATIELGASPINIRLTFALTDLLVAGVDGNDEAQLKDAAVRAVEWRTVNGPATIQVLSAKKLDATAAEFVLSVDRVPGTFKSLLLPEMPMGHRQLLVVRDHAGESYRIQMLSARSAVEQISQRDLERTSSPPKIEATGRSFPNLPWLAGGVFLMALASLGAARGRRVDQVKKEERK